MRHGIGALLFIGFSIPLLADEAGWDSLESEWALYENGVAVFGPLTSSGVIGSDSRFTGCEGHRVTRRAVLRGCCEVEVTVTVEVPGSTHPVFLGVGPEVLGQGDVLSSSHQTEEGTEYEFTLSVLNIEHHEPETGPEVVFASAKPSDADLDEIRILLADQFPLAYAAGMELDSAMSDGSDRWFASVVLGPLGESRGEVATLRVKCDKNGGPWSCDVVRRERRYVVPGNSVPVLAGDNVSFDLVQRVYRAVNREFEGYEDAVEEILGRDWQLKSVRERRCSCYGATVEGEFRGRPNKVFFGFRESPGGVLERDARGCLLQSFDSVG